MKILLTGKPGIGKSTIVQKILSSYKEPYFGVIASEMREAKERVGFKVSSLKSNLKPRILAHKFEVSSDQKVADFFVDLSVVNDFIIPILNDGIKFKGLTVCDEIGRMQSLSSNFIECLKQIVNNDSNFLGTIVKDDEPWSMYFKNHPEIYLFNVTKDNRDGIDKDVLYLMEQMSNKDKFHSLDFSILKSLITDYINNGKNTQLRKLFDNAIPYINDNRINRLDKVNFLVSGFTTNHKVELKNGRYVCDCNLFNGLNGYEAGECSHIQSIKLGKSYVYL